MQKKMGKAFAKSVWSNKYMYLFLLPAVIWYFIFCYVPMYGVTLAFKDYRFDRGILGSSWVGMKYLYQFINSYDFWKIINNTLLISALKLLVGFPAPIILALMLNEIRKGPFKRVIQTVSYLPYFVSWVVVVMLFSKLLTPNGGVLNDLKVALFGGEPVFFMGEKVFFYPLVVIMDVWKNMGWWSIIYLAQIMGIDPCLYEAASIDGASGWKSLVHITLPGLRPVMGIILIMSVGNLVRAGFDQIYLMQNPGVLDISEILDTHVLKRGILKGEFSYATAVSLFQSAVSLFLIVFTNKIVRKTSEISLW